MEESNTDIQNTAEMTAAQPQAEPAGQAIDQPETTLAVETNPARAEHTSYLCGKYGEAFKPYFEAVSNGGLSDQQYKELEAKGINRDAIQHVIELEDQVASAKRTQAENSAASMLAIVGGEKGYEEIKAWAQSGLQPEEIEAYNSIMESGTDAQRRFALQSIHSRYTAANGREPKRVLQGATRSRGPAGYGSKEEAISDMMKPEYRTDRAFQQKVEAKLRNSSLFIRGRY